jgi:hypothetical protein
MDCWAACLGDCGDKASREHLVSASLFVDDEILVQGFPWCPEGRKIGLANLTAKILCERHNNILSPVDEGGAEAFNTLREFNRIEQARQRIRVRITNVIKHRINGLILERWFLKTLINFSYNGDKPIGRGSQVAGKPSDELVRIAFGLSHFRGRAGLSFVVRVGMQIRSQDIFKFAPLIKDGRIEGGLFVFRGQPMLLYLGEEGVPVPLSGVHVEGEDLGSCLINFHNERITANRGKHPSQVIRIDWPK